MSVVALNNNTTLTVDQAWNAVMAAVRVVGKDSYNKEQHFRFRGVDAVVEAVGPALREHGVTVLPKKIRKIKTVEYESKRGGRMVNKQVTVQWEVRGPGGDTFTGESVGEAADVGDKAVTKAQSVAYRVFLLQALCIPTGDADPDASSHERASASEKQGRSPEPDDAVEAANEARGTLLARTEPYGWDAERLIERWRSDYGSDLLELIDIPTIIAFGDALIAEAQEAGEPEDRISDRQLRKLHVLLKQEGFTDHDAYIVWCTDALGYAIASTKDLTASEGSKLIGKLEALEKARSGQRKEVAKDNPS